MLLRNIEETQSAGGNKVRSSTFNPLPLLIVDEIGGVPVGRGGYLSDMNRLMRCRFQPFRHFVSSPLASAIPRNATGHGKGEGG